MADTKGSTKASTKKKAEEPEAVENEAEAAETAETSEAEDDTSSAFPEVNNFNMVLITALGLALLVVIVMLASGTSPEEVAGEMEEMADEVAVANNAPETSTTIQGPSTPSLATAATSAPAATPPSAPAANTASTETGDVVGDGIIERKGEGRHFYTTIKIPPNAETLYLSGSGARQQDDGTWGDMEQQTVNTFSRFQETLEAEGWSMSDIVQVRAFAVAGEFGLLDFDGFNRGYRQFFGTEENPMKPVRSFVQIAGLVVPGWLVEIEIRAARTPE